MDVTPSSRNVSSVSVVQKEIAKTPKSTGGTSTQYRPARGFVVVTIRVVETTDQETGRHDRNGEGP